MRHNQGIKLGMVLHGCMNPLGVSLYQVMLGTLPGVDTGMLYNQTEDIGVIYLANGNPVLGSLTVRRMVSRYIDPLFIVHKRRNPPRGDAA